MICLFLAAMVENLAVWPKSSTWYIYRNLQIYFCLSGPKTNISRGNICLSTALALLWRTYSSKKTNICLRNHSSNLTVVIYGKKSPSKSPSKSHVPQTVGQRVPQILDYVPQILSWGTYSQHQTPSIGGQPVTLYLSSYSIEWIKHFKRVNLTKRSLFSRRWKITNGRFEKGGACRCNYVVDPSFMAETTTTPSPPRNHPKKIVS